MPDLFFYDMPRPLPGEFSAIPVYHNNIWKVPGFARVVETGASFFSIETTDPKARDLFKSQHELSALVDVGYCRST